MSLGIRTHTDLNCFVIFSTFRGRRGSWSYGSWIYNYLYNLCLSPLKLWVRTPFIARCTRYNIMS